MMLVDESVGLTSSDSGSTTSSRLLVVEGVLVGLSVDNFFADDRLRFFFAGCSSTLLIESINFPPLFRLRDAECSSIFRLKTGEGMGL